ncbi:MAG: preprotein translocase subunit SecA [Betaproteobacteria bacterium RIFCSPLOWO2_12_FULL_63_13]|nr:MAG: preprotein translocase subunit SecA [Betaproteobacteria bacterium RIFCSPLOWO2_12_FULL_63_13]
MISRILKAIFGSRNDRLLKRYSRVVREINAFESAISTLSDAALAGKTAEFKDRLAKGEILDQVLPEAFAVVREAARRVLNMRHFDVQLLGGMVLHYGKIGEMRTGEGKTLVATLPAYLNALTGRGVHIVTVNDYLANRDAEWMGKVYRFLGLTVGVILSQMPHDQKQENYAADITYGTNNEFGFDYLRDNMAMQASERYQRPLHYAIVDEVDSILIDEARTPLIISGQAEDRTDLYARVNEIGPLLKRQEKEGDPGDFFVDEKAHSVMLSEAGHEHAEELMSRVGLLPEGRSLYEPAYVNLVHHLNQALRAHNLFFRDRHYVVQDNEIVIVDEFTGRLMAGRRWSDGLHQAIEAKEHVTIQNENQTLASITFQNYFRMYKKLAGMTGTADTEAYEFQQIYNLETVVIPTNVLMIRTDRLDQVFRTVVEKYKAIIDDITDCYECGQPVLVGTTSIENSELIAGMLQRKGVPHQVLNAKQHAREAEIVAQAGRPKMITIATNMAGRGTDIVLGGNVEKQVDMINATAGLDDVERERRIHDMRNGWQALHDEVVAAGGLHIVGTERHESRRIDNQLRGRSGRQGDPGSSRFYLSLEDPLLRIFAGDKVKAIMERLKMPEGESIEHPLVTRSIESAQRKVEAHNFDMRKQLLEYDDVANDQRRHIYELRNAILDSTDVSDRTQALREGVVTDIFRAHIAEESVEEQWDVAGLEKTLAAELQLVVPLTTWLEQEPNADDGTLLARAVAAANDAYKRKMETAPADALHQYERFVLLSSLDSNWREHLAALEHLRQGIHLRGYAQKNPKQEYKREAFELFGDMLETVKLEVTRNLMNVQIRTQEEVEQVERELAPAVENVQYQHPSYQEEAATGTDDRVPAAAAKAQPFVRHMGKIGRNDPCPCGSGRKYKHCHGRLA